MMQFYNKNEMSTKAIQQKMKVRKYYEKYT